MCAPMLPTEFLIHEKFRERFRAAAIRLCLERLYCAASLPNLAGFFCTVCRLTLYCLQIDKCTTNTYAVIGAQHMRNMGKGGC